MDPQAQYSHRNPEWTAEKHFYLRDEVLLHSARQTEHPERNRCISDMTLWGLAMAVA